MEQTPKPTEPAKPKSSKTMYAAVGAVVIIIVVILALYFGGVFNTTNTPGTPGTIYGTGTYSNCPPACGYDPSPLTIAHGTKVTWTNNSTSPHTVTECITSSDSTSCPNKDSSALSPTLDSGTGGIAISGGTYSYTFATAGTYYYYCRFHPGMHGQVVVT